MVGLFKQGPKRTQKIYLCPPSHRNRALRIFVPMSEPQSKKTVSASRTLIKQKRKNFEDESASCVFSFSPVKTCFLLHGRESRASFFYLYSFSIEECFPV